MASFTRIPQALALRAFLAGLMGVAWAVCNGKDWDESGDQ
jgi:hypothetical protein